MAFIIIEYNGPDYINLVSDTKGRIKTFSTANNAKKWAGRNLAFNSKIVRLY